MTTCELSNESFTIFLVNIILMNSSPQERDGIPQPPRGSPTIPEGIPHNLIALTPLFPPHSTTPRLAPLPTTAPVVVGRNERWAQIFVFINHRDFNRHHSQGRRPSKTLVKQNHLLLFLISSSPRGFVRQTTLFSWFCVLSHRAYGLR